MRVRTGQDESPSADCGKADRVRRMFNRIARRYTLTNAVLSLGRDGYWRREAVRLAEVQPADRLLDACCGPGELADAFAAARPAPARIVGCDFAEEMLAEAARRQQRRPRPIELVHADALDLPFADASFEIVGCAFGLRNLANPSAGLAEFGRVLVPGGRLVVLEFAPPGDHPLRTLYQAYLRRVLPRAGRLVGGYGPACHYLPESVEAFFQPDQIADMLEAAGFVGVRQRSMTWAVAVVTVGRRR